MKDLREHTKRSNDLVRAVMRQDIQYRSFKRLMKTFETQNALFLVLHINDYLAQDRSAYRIQKQLKKYFKDVDNQVFSPKSNKQLSRYVVIENLKNIRRNHVQIAIECPRHLTKSKLRNILRNSLNNQICNLEHINEVYDYETLIDYNSKDIKSVKPYQTDITFDEMNSHKRVA